MAKGQTYSHERVRLEDPETSVGGWQLTSFPSHSMHLGYLQNSFTPDARTLLFVCQRSAARDAPWDLFRVDTDGLNLTQLTDADDARAAVLGPGGEAAYLCRGGSLWRVTLADAREEEVARCDDVEEAMGLSGYLAHDGAYYFARAQLKGGAPGVARFALDGSESRIIRRGADAGFHGVDSTGLGIAAVVVRDGREVFVRYDYDGAGERTLGPNVFAHSSWLSGTGMIQGCALPPQRAVLLMPEGEEPKPLVEGHYFWHSGSSYDGRWIVADTNWPNEGLWLISVEARRAARLCRTPNTAGHPQWGHPHPTFSPDGRLVAFNSDPHGVGQVFVAEVPGALRAEMTRPV
jgi:hypothetical protein